MAEALFQDVQADSAKLHEWEIQAKLTSDENKKRIIEKENIVKMLKEEASLKIQDLREAEARSQAMSKKVESLKRDKNSLVMIQSYIVKEVEELKQKILAHCNDVSTFGGSYEALNEKLGYLNQDVDSTRVQFVKDKEELRTKINEVLERERMLKTSETEFLNSFYDEEVKLLQIGAAHSNELSRLKVDLDSEWQKANQEIEKINSVLKAKKQEAADLHNDSNAVKAIVEEHSHCSGQMKDAEEVGEASITAAKVLIEQAREETERLKAEHQCAIQETENLKSKLEEKNAKGKTTISELQSCLSRVTSQNSINQSIINQHAQCPIEIANLTQSLEQLKAQRQQAISLHQKELQSLEERNVKKTIELRSILEDRVAELEKINAEILNTEKEITLQCDQEAILGNDLCSKGELLNNLKLSNASLAEKNCRLKTDLRNMEDNLKELLIQKEDVFNAGEKIKQNISNLQHQSLEGSQMVLSLMNTLRSKEFEISVSKRKLEDEISCLRTKLSLAKNHETKILNAMESHKKCKAQETHLRQEFDSKRAELIQELDKLKEENVEVSKKLQSMKCQSMMLEPELMTQIQKKDSEIDNLESKLKMAAERTYQFQIAIAEHEKCDEEVSKLQKCIDELSYQISKAIGVSIFNEKSQRAKHEETLERVQSTVEEFRMDLRNQKERVSHLTDEISKLEAQLMKPNSETTKKNEKSPSVISQLATGIGQLFSHSLGVPQGPPCSRSMDNPNKSPSR